MVPISFSKPGILAPLMVAAARESLIVVPPTPSSSQEFFNAHKILFVIGEFFILKRVSGARQLVGSVPERVQRTKGKNTPRLCRGIGRHGGLGPGLCPGVLTPFIHFLLFFT